MAPDQETDTAVGAACGAPELLGGVRGLLCSSPHDDALPAGTLDRQDVLASIDGDGGAYGRLVRRYQNEIARYMWRFTRDRAECEELVQDVFVEAFVSLPGYRGEAPFLHWLRKIATRAGYRYWKRQARERSRAEVPLDEQSAALAVGQEPQDAAWAAETLHALLSELSLRDRLVLTMLYLEEQGVDEIAKATGWSRSMVKVQAYRARRRFRRVLEKHDWRRDG